ncbi:MAG: hypothetical protein RLZZ444_260, partial [Pseudomonadota bacterium]
TFFLRALKQMKERTMKIMLAVCTALGVMAVAAPSFADTVRI